MKPSQDSEAFISFPASVTSCKWQTGHFYVDTQARMMSAQAQLLQSSDSPLFHLEPDFSSTFSDMYLWWPLILSEVLCIQICVFKMRAG